MLLVLILMLSGVVNAMESEVGKRVVTINGEKIHVNILVDNEFERIVETEDQYTINITTFNKEKNYIVVEEINKITGEESITTADLNQIDFDLISSEDSGLEMHPCATILFSASSVFIKINTFIGQICIGEYTILQEQEKAYMKIHLIQLI